MSDSFLPWRDCILKIDAGFLARCYILQARSDCKFTEG
jgi:hypothetical protein